MIKSKNVPIEYLFLAVLLTASHTSFSQEIPSFRPSVSVSGEYNDNLRLINNVSDEVSGGRLDAAFRFVNSSPTTEFIFEPRVLATLYPSSSDEESTDTFLKAKLSSVGQRAKFELSAEVSDEKIVGNYFPGSDDDENIGDPDAGIDSSVGDSGNRRLRYSVKPSLSYRFSEKAEINVGISHLDVSFDENMTSNRRVDYTDSAIFLGVAYRLNPRNTLSLKMSQSRYDQSDLKSDTSSAEAEFSVSASENSRFYISAGAERTEDNASVGKSTTFAGGVGYRHKGLTHTLMIDLNRYTDPSEKGALVERTQLRARMDKRISEKLAGHLGARVVESSGLRGLTSVPGVKYYSLEGGLRWRLSESFSIFGTYIHKKRDEEDIAGQADGAVLNLGVTWEPYGR